MAYPVTVKCKGEIERHLGRKLTNKGLIKVSCNMYKGFVTGWKFKSLKRLCQKHGITVFIDNSLGTRSFSYRNEFRKHWKPSNTGIYLCSYCGKKLKPSKLIVDHIFPVGLAKQSIFVQKELRIFGIKDINSWKNLAPSCKRCNSRKGMKTGLWVIRGFIGRHRYIRKLINIIRNIIYFIVFVILIISLYRWFNSEGLSIIERGRQILSGM